MILDLDTRYSNLDTNNERQKQFAKEVQRVGENYFVQTPNYWIPIGPHFMFPLFHWLPVSVRVFLITHFRLGWYEQFGDTKTAEKLVKETRLMQKYELKKIFIEGKIFEEKFFGQTKSF